MRVKSLINMEDKNKKACLELSSQEICTICGALYKSGYSKRDLGKELYLQLAIVRDLVIHGHVDHFTIGKEDKHEQN